MSAPSDDIADINVYTPENLILQAQQAEERLGYKLVHFYVEPDGTLSKHKTDTTAQFYLSPSGGTLRDAEFNIVLYSAKFDRFKGYGKRDVSGQ
ncbi:MAG: hypothetical protein J5I53_06505 [Bradyrhizobiaceae bacterium]|nr:hypothetical protein [Bradyrhizobiaceae bacterium]